MATDGRISSMIRDLEPDETNIFETSKPSGGSTSGYITRAVSLNGIANAVLNEMEYTTDLETEAKQVIPAINEIYTKGGKDSVLFVPQELTEAQKVQARQNIGASGGSDVTMQDNTKGGVDLTVGGVTRTLINKSDVTFSENKSGGVDLSVYNTSATLAKQSDLDDLRAEINNKTLRFVDQNEEGMNTPPEGAIIESLLTVDGKSEQNTTNGYQLISSYIGELSFSYEAGQGQFTVGRIGNEIRPFFKKVKTFVLSFKTNWTGVIRLQLQKSNYLNLGNFTIENGIAYKIFTIPESHVSPTNVLVQFSSVTLTGDFYIKDVMLEEGDVVHDYETYTGGIPSPNPEYPQDMGGYVEEINFLKTGKNLISATSPNEYKQGTPTSTASNRISTVNPLKVRHTKYTVSCSEEYYILFVYVTMKNGAVVGYGANGFSGGNNYSNSLLLDLTDTSRDVEAIRVAISKPENANLEPTEASSIKLMVERGTIATRYEPHREESRIITPPFPLKKIRETSDYCDVTQGEWVRYFDLRQLSAEENWTSHAISGSDTKRYKYTVLDLKQFQTDLPDIMSNYFTAITSLEAQTGDYLGIYIGNYAVEVCVTQQTVEEFKQWLEETEVYLLAPLIKPVTEPIETEDLFYLRSLQNLPAENILTITDQNGEDCSYLMKYLVQRGATT